jgi:tetratricopeptide (TPR) repeat protein
MSHQVAIKYYNTALQYAKNRNLDDAIESLNEAITSDPNHVNSYNVLGKVYIQKGDIGAARSCWHKALDIDPNDAVASQCLSATRTRHLQTQSYTLILITIIIMLATALIISFLLSRHKINNLQSEIAEATKQTTANIPEAVSIPKLETKSQVTETYNNALTEYRIGRYDSAIRMFQQVLEYPPSHQFKDNAQYWLGECYYSKGTYDQALIEFQQVRKFFPKSDKVFYADLKSAYSYYEKDQVELARQKLLQLSKYRSSQEYRNLIELAKLKFRIQKRHGSQLR